MLGAALDKKLCMELCQIKSYACCRVKAGLQQMRRAKLSRECWFVLWPREIPDVAFASQVQRHCCSRSDAFALRMCFACGLPGHLRCGINRSLKTQVKCSDWKHVVACLLAVACRLSQKEVKKLPQLPRKKQIFRRHQVSVTHSHCKFQWLANEIGLPTFL